MRSSLARHCDDGRADANDDISRSEETADS